MENEKKIAWVTSVFMGLGHMRAAYALKDLANEGILIDGSKRLCTPSEYSIWKWMRKMYYFLSRAEKIPFIGRLLHRFLYLMEEIPAYYPKRDLSASNWSVKYLKYLITGRGLGKGIVTKITQVPLPVINTFYATAVAVDQNLKNKDDNYLLICDSDFNRIWVGEDPKTANIKYVAPCSRVKKRLLSYGVPESKIFVTGFPLPKENIGSREGLEILKSDLYKRLVKLDPQNAFFNIHRNTVEYYLGKPDCERIVDSKSFTLMFAVGGAGCQTGLGVKILKSLRRKIKKGSVKLILSSGIRKDVYNEFLKAVVHMGIFDYVGNGIELLHDADIYGYFNKFNAALRNTDVLWTKPSELSFYCALGIPILLAPVVGSHEYLNRKWLQEIHTGVKPSGTVEHTNEWLFDLRESGVLAEAAWDGFLKARKLGVYYIEDLMSKKTFQSGSSPLER